MPNEIRALRDRGALFVVNHSAGKDSQAMLVFLRRHIPAEQLVLIHADLGEVEWPGNVAHIERYAGGLPLLVARARRGLLQMVEDRFAARPEVPSWPSPKNRQCTSDLKRGPIEREIRRYLRNHPAHNGLVVNCMGMRAQESPGRSKLNPFKLNQSNSKAGREWYDWLPIHDWTVDQVFDEIRAAGEEPHPVYAKGMTRLSCCFCIMASKGDLRTASRLNPGLYQRYVDLERRTGHTMSMSGIPLDQIISGTA
ncbi:phosphoadenosine phosphosulfate reductase family protein [Methylobacterium ajmalii]|uniref:phosphoadenosine phosphosulfate reductase family protein n=1 Tax=Methylobacterium ajmalii TaxID=2738439 RepID=UPI002F35DAE2